MAEAFDSINSGLLILARYLFILIVSYGLAWLTFPSLVKLFNEAGLVKSNYRDQKIPALGGVLFIVIVPLITTIGIIFRVSPFINQITFIFLFVLMAIGFMGFFDDQLGIHKIKGFKGHFRMLFEEKKLTSGAFKAIFGAIVALVFSFGTAEFNKGNWSIWTLIANFLLVVLAANTVNIFDLRPGRAGKVYLLGFIMILLFSQKFESYTGMFIPILAITIYYLPFDLQGKVMLGDSGANLLGASLGMMMAWMLSDVGKILGLIVLVGLQLIAERYSFTEIIKQYRVLRYIDELGRRKDL